MDGDPTPALTGRRRTRPTSIGCRNPWQPEPGRAPLIAAQAAVQTNRATSIRFTTVVANGGGEGLKPFGAASAQRDLRSALGEQACGGFSDTAARARDGDDLAFDAGHGNLPIRRRNQ